MTEVKLKVVEFESGSMMDEVHGYSEYPAWIAIVTEDGKRLVATMRNPAFAGGDETQIRADADRLVECWNRHCAPTDEDKIAIHT